MVINIARKPYKIIYTLWDDEQKWEMLIALQNSKQFNNILKKKFNKYPDPTEMIDRYWEMLIEQIPRLNIEPQHLTPYDLIYSINTNSQEQPYIEARIKCFAYLRTLMLRIQYKNEDIEYSEDIGNSIINNKTYPNDFLYFIRYELKNYLSQSENKKWTDYLSGRNKNKKSILKIKNKIEELYRDFK